MKAASVRSKAGTLAYLKRQQKHGKREDYIGKKRKVRDVPPLVYGSLNLELAYEEHVGSARKNSAAKNVVLHSIFRFPPELLSLDAGPFKGSKTERQQLMMDLAVKFTNDTQGGNAVFAARLDRDEEGESIVDVFYAPVYEKRTKRTPVNQPGQQWVSLTKFNKELAEKHRSVIEPRLEDSTNPDKLTSPRAVGMAMQEELGELMQSLGINLEDRTLKNYASSDWVSKEQHELERLALRRTQLETQASVIGLLDDVIEYKRLQNTLEAEARLERAERGATKAQDHAVLAHQKAMEAEVRLVEREALVASRESAATQKEADLQARQKQLEVEQAQLALDQSINEISRKRVEKEKAQLEEAEASFAERRTRLVYDENRMIVKIKAINEREESLIAGHAELSEGQERLVRQTERFRDMVEDRAINLAQDFGTTIISILKEKIGFNGDFAIVPIEKLNESEDRSALNAFGVYKLASILEKILHWKIQVMPEYKNAEILLSKINTDNSLSKAYEIFSENCEFEDNKPSGL